MRGGKKRKVKKILKEKKKVQTTHTLPSGDPNIDSVASCLDSGDQEKQTCHEENLPSKLQACICDGKAITITLGTLGTSAPPGATAQITRRHRLSIPRPFWNGSRAVRKNLSQKETHPHPIHNVTLQGPGLPALTPKAAGNLLISVGP